MRGRVAAGRVSLALAATVLQGIRTSAISAGQKVSIIQGLSGGNEEVVQML